MESQLENGYCMEDGETSCLFCSLEDFGILAANEYAVAVPDAFPVSPGHTLIIPRRHFTSLFGATNDERAALLTLLADVRERIMQERNAEGFNIGINEAYVAGQTILHLHIHLIPRYRRDCLDPRGGVRKLLPNMACHRKWH